MRKSELLSMAEIRKWEEETMSGINDTKKTKNDMSENQAEYLKKEGLIKELDYLIKEVQDSTDSRNFVQVAQNLDRQELRKWIVELVLTETVIEWEGNADMINACKLIEDYILGK